MVEVPETLTAEPKTRGRGPSMADVARIAGVSGQTVSRVVNGRSNVDEGTRTRVLEAMRTVGYRPNNAARALRLGRFGNIGVIMFTLSSFGNMRTLDEIAMAASDANYSLTLIPVRRPSQTDVTKAFARLNKQAVDGVIIVIETSLIDTNEVHWPTGLPVVVIDAGADLPHPIVDTDQAEGARLATEHLLGLGHGTVWHVSGPPNSYSANRRRQSWHDTLLRHDRPVPSVIVGNWSSDSGYQAGLWLADKPEVSAVFTANDQMALGVLRALHERGRRVPGEVSVVGFDDMAEARNFWPPLTTVRQNFEGVGRRSVDMLIHGIRHGGNHHGNHHGNHGATAENVLIPTHLVLRESSAPPQHPGRG